MADRLETAYGLGRLAFGAALIVAPRQFGRMFLGDEAAEPAVRIALRTYGTRDVVLGLGTLRAVSAGADPRPWLTAGITADALDTAIQIGEFSDLPPDKRVLGVLMALGAAGAGLALRASR